MIDHEIPHEKREESRDEAGLGGSHAAHRHGLACAGVGGVRRFFDVKEGSTHGLAYLSIMRCHVALVMLASGVAACSILSGASDLTIGGPGIAGGEGGVANDAGDGDARPSGDGAITLADGAVVAPGGLADTAFGTNGRVLIDFGASDQGRVSTVDPATGVVVVGGRSGSGIPTNFAIARLTAAGVLDTTFGIGGKTTVDFAADYDEVTGIARLSDNRYLATGRAWNGGFVIAGTRLEPSGEVDTTFGKGFAGGGNIGGPVQYGTANANNQDGTFTMVLRPGDRYVVAGSSDGNVALTAFGADGTAEGAFLGFPTATVIGASGVIRAIARQSDDKLWVAGWSPPYTDATSTNVIIERRASDLRLEPNFDRIVIDSGMLEHAYAVAIAPDGKIVVAGDTKASAASDEDVLLLRLLPTGVLDTTFGVGGKVITTVANGSNDRGRAVAIDALGRILVAGSTTAGKDQDVLLLRYSANGVLDPLFGKQGVVAAEYPGTEEARDLRLMNDGRIVVTGSADRGANVPSDMMVMRFLP